MAQKCYSRYELLGGFGRLLELNLAVGFLCFAIFFNQEIDFQENSHFMASTFVICMVEFLTLLLFMKRCRYIVITDEHITYINPLFPFIRKQVSWKSYDFYCTVDEGARGPNKAIWLIKDNKVKIIISSFYYSNYDALRRRIGVPSEGKLKVNPFMKIGCYLGMKVPL